MDVIGTKDWIGFFLTLLAIMVPVLIAVFGWVALMYRNMKADVRNATELAAKANNTAEEAKADTAEIKNDIKEVNKSINDAQNNITARIDTLMQCMAGGK